MVHTLMIAATTLKPRHFTVPIDGKLVCVFTDGSLVTPRNVDAIREVIRELRTEQWLRRAAGDVA